MLRAEPYTLIPFNSIFCCEQFVQLRDHLSWLKLDCLEAIWIQRPSCLPRMTVRLPHRTSLGIWKALILICLLTFPLVQVVPCPGTPKSPSVLRQGKRKCWQVSSLGRCRTSQGSITLGCLDGDGYRRVNIAGFKFRVHRLVAWACLEAPPSEAAWQVNHLDGNKSNNQVANLAWVTPSQNIQHSFSHSFACQRRKTRHQSRPVTVNGTQFSSITSAAGKLDQSFTTVSRLCKANAKIDSCEYGLVKCNGGSLPGEIWKPMTHDQRQKWRSSSRQTGELTGENQVQDGSNILWMSLERRVPHNMCIHVRAEAVGACAPPCGIHFLRASANCRTHTSKSQG